MITILIADPHAIVRRGMHVLITEEPDMLVIGESDDGYEVVNLARELQPDIILMEIGLHGQDGIATLEQIRGENPAARVLFLTSMSDNEHIMAAVRAGAAGYVLKDAAPSQVLQAIRDIARGESHLHPTIAIRMLRDFDSSLASPYTRSTPDEPLTNREIQVLRYVAQGYSNNDIAKFLQISERTVGNHIGSILHKLHVANRTQAALYALRRGIVDIYTPAGAVEDDDSE
jgi:NarL family two-component system response regulator LiaR